MWFALGTSLLTPCPARPQIQMASAESAVLGSLAGFTMLYLTCSALAIPLLPRSQLQLAAELLPRHITSLSQRLDYMQQLLGLEELGVVERCELAARLLLSIRGDLVPCSQRPVMGNGWGWWQVQMWEVPRGAQGGKERQNLQSQLGTFLKTFFKLAGQVRSSLYCMLYGKPTCMLRAGHVQAGRLLCRSSNQQYVEAQPVWPDLTLHPTGSTGGEACSACGSSVCSRPCMYAAHQYPYDDPQARPLSRPGVMETCLNWRAAGPI
jgi:hypothetical protein